MDGLSNPPITSSQWQPMDATHLQQGRKEETYITFIVKRKGDLILYYLRNNSLKESLSNSTEDSSQPIKWLGEIYLMHINMQMIDKRQENKLAFFMYFVPPLGTNFILQ